MKNSRTAEIFRNVAYMLEIKGENPFRIRAYQKAAQIIENLTEDLTQLAEEDRLIELPGIGEDLARKIKEILKTGTLKTYENLKKEVPEEVLDMLGIPGLGPKTVKMLFEQLKIKNTADLKKAAKQGKLTGIEGIREKTVENILRGIAVIEENAGRMLLNTADSAAAEIIFELKKMKEVKKINIAGSLRRMKETVRDIDILVSSSVPRKVMDKFTRLKQVRSVIGKGETKSSVLIEDGVQADLRVVADESYGAAFLYFTGSKAHNIKLRAMARKKKMKVSEYGLFKGSARIAGRTEEEMYEKLGLSFIPPELREDSGEVEAAQKNELPRLIDYSDIKGDLHVHSNKSDGSYSVEQLVEAAQKRGYEYIAITDHSQGLKVAGGLSVNDAKKHIEYIRKLNQKLKGITLLTGFEIDIKDDGSLDYPDSLLKELDIVIGAIHTGFKQSKEKLTNRIIKAMQNKYTTFISHPSGRLIGAREPYEIDYDEIFKAARDTNTFLEISAYPQRLDLTDVWARRAKEKGVKMVIVTDAHILDHFDYMKYGVAVARRGWLEKKDVINTLPLEELKKIL
ncbi:MAG: DNA polymerase/3'-5' exonuclease PolX, partial [Candidatus Omnitrophota bacterium]